MNDVKLKGEGSIAMNLDLSSNLNTILFILQLKVNIKGSTIYGVNSFGNKCEFDT